jgi:hypothetical protein
MIDRHGGIYEERNGLLQVTLGVVSLCQRFMALVNDPPDESDTHGVAAARPPDIVLDFLLGLIGFTQRVAVHLQAVEQQVDPAAVAPARRAAEPAAASLRRLLA